MRYAAIGLSMAGTVVFAALIPFTDLFLAPFVAVALLSAIGVWDILQSSTRRFGTASSSPAAAIPPTPAIGQVPIPLPSRPW